MREVAIEILRYDPEAGPVTLDSFAVITSQLNSRIRNRGLSAWGILHQRDQESGHQLPFIEQSSSTPPTLPCKVFACDVMRRYK